jgi:hypothetical protein
MVDRAFHKLDPLGGLLILDSDPAVDLDDRDLVAVHCQLALRAARSCCARTDTASPPAAASIAGAWSPWPSNAFAALTRALAG